MRHVRRDLFVTNKMKSSLKMSAPFQKNYGNFFQRHRTIAISEGLLVSNSLPSRRWHSNNWHIKIVKPLYKETISLSVWVEVNGNEMRSNTLMLTAIEDIASQINWTEEHSNMVRATGLLTKDPGEIKRFHLALYETFAEMVRSATQEYY